MVVCNFRDKTTRYCDQPLLEIAVASLIFTFGMIGSQKYHVNFFCWHKKKQIIIHCYSIYISLHNDGTCSLATKDCIPFFWFCFFPHGSCAVWFNNVLE